MRCQDFSLVRILSPVARHWGGSRGQCEGYGVQQQIRQVPRRAMDAEEGACLCRNGTIKRFTFGTEDVEKQKYLHGLLG